MSRSAFGIFARAPVPGATKTRLIPALGAEGPVVAARLHEAFLADLLPRVAEVAPVTLFVAGAADHPTFVALEAAHGIRIAPQVDGDLGARMGAALDALLTSGAERAFLVGSDAPTLPRRILERAVGHDADVVLTPSVDGGYVLVGGCRVPDFREVPWSSPTTLAATRARNPGAELTEPWYDVDEPEDLELLRLQLTLDPGAAPQTARLLARLPRADVPAPRR